MASTPMGLSASLNEPAAVFAQPKKVRRRIRLCGVVIVVSSGSFRYYSPFLANRGASASFFSSKLLWLTDRMRPSSGKVKKN
jgi:hypothetical protein